MSDPNGTSVVALADRLWQASVDRRPIEPITRARPDLTVVNIRGNVQGRLDKVRRGEVAASLLAMAGLNRLGLEDAPEAYRTFREKEDGCIKVVLKP